MYKREEEEENMGEGQERWWGRGQEGLDRAERPREGWCRFRSKRQSHFAIVFDWWSAFGI